MSILEEMFEGSNSEQLNERPYSRTQSAIDSVKGKAKGVFGSGQMEQGAQEVGSQANQLWMDFKRFIGRKYGKAQASVPFGDVEGFFKQNNLPTKILGTNTRRSFAPKDVGNAILAAAREMATSDPEQQQPQGQPQQQQQGGGQPAQGQPQGQPQQAPAPQSTAGGLEGKLASLSPSDREKLLSMLQ